MTATRRSRRPPNAAIALMVSEDPCPLSTNTTDFGPTNGHGRWGGLMSALVAGHDRDVSAGSDATHQHHLGAGFLRLLCTQPEGDTVAFALLHGPCAAYHAQACAIYLADAERTHLALVGESGFGRESLQRYQVIPLDVGIPGALAYRTGEPMVVRGHEAEERFPLLSAFFTSEPMGRASDWICLPLTYLGAGMGAIVIACPAGLSWGWAEQSHFDGFAAAVSLWARALQLDADPQVASRHRSRDGRSRVGTVALSERQLQVLAGIRQGKPNKVIARELGYSISTIKAEVQHILACLGATNRRDAIVRAGNAGITLPAPHLAGTDLAR